MIIIQMTCHALTTNISYIQRTITEHIVVVVLACSLALHQLSTLHCHRHLAMVHYAFHTIIKKDNNWDNDYKINIIIANLTSLD